MALTSRCFATPLGELVAVFSEQGLCLLEYGDATARLERALGQVHAARGGPLRRARHPLAEQLERELEGYFTGERRAFELPLDLVGTAFQRLAWRALLRIPFGQTRSYTAQALALGKPTAVRAVAAANGSNKLSVVVPCHRVLGRGGDLAGYGGGLARKQWLLDWEAARAGQP